MNKANSAFDYYANVSKKTLLASMQCEKCGEVRSKTQIEYVRDFGPFKKGQIAIHEKECNCRLIEEAKAAHKRMKANKILSLSQFNKSLDITSKTFNFDIDDEFYGKTSYKFLADGLSFKEGQVFYLFGAAGIGKSHLAMYLHELLTEKGYVSLFLNVTQLLEVLRMAMFNKDYDLSENDIYEAIAEADMVIFDDLGLNTETEWELGRLYSILNRRLGKSFVVTSNIRPEKLKKTYGDAIGSRFFEGLTDDRVFHLALSLQDSIREKGMKHYK